MLFNVTSSVVLGAGQAAIFAGNIFAACLAFTAVIELNAELSIVHVSSVQRFCNDDCKQYNTQLSMGCIKTTMGGYVQYM